MLEKIKKVKFPAKFLTYQKTLKIIVVALFAVLLGISKPQANKSVQGISSKNESTIKVCTLHAPIGQTNSIPPNYIYPTLPPGGKYCDYPKPTLSKNVEMKNVITHVIISLTPSLAPTQSSPSSQTTTTNSSQPQTVETKVNGEKPTPTLTSAPTSTPTTTPTLQACIECAAPPAGCNYQGLSCSSCGTLVCAR